MNITDKGTHQK